MDNIPSVAFKALKDHLEGDFYFDELMQILYATDASVYRELPLAVAIPKSKNDLKELLTFARSNSTFLIPRTAGTSLAGQCVGAGIVVDVSKYFTKILELNVEEKWVRVEPGVIRNQLNNFLKPHGLFFSPITSTANRAMIGGMVGNNSCGTNSIVYGTTRDKVLALDCLLSDGSEVVFSAINQKEFKKKMALENLEGNIYKNINAILANQNNQSAITDAFPKPAIHRRNTGYAIDELLDNEVFGDSTSTFNFCKLLAGSEGTLAFTTAIKIALDDLPPSENVILAAHFHTLKESLLATQIAMEHQPYACELMDKIILDCTKENIEQRKNRFFLEGDPASVLLVEFRADTNTAANALAEACKKAIQRHELGYAFPVIQKAQTPRIWNLRSAGLGVLANIPGDAKAVTCIEDTAVAIHDLPAYIQEVEGLMKKYGQQSVYYAHAGAGELHLRPILNLKKKKDLVLFQEITNDVAKLVKSYKGSLSGEHGDGRVRAPFLEFMVGEKVYAFFKQIKAAWDPEQIFNRGKILDAPPMTESLRYVPGKESQPIKTLLDFSENGGFLRTAEKCNGSGDCRKFPEAGGTMCPSYMATRNEKDNTRGRANVLREYLTNSSKSNPFDHQEIKEVLDLCLSCKGCTSECPSNVDMTNLKAEFQYQYNRTNGTPFRSIAFAYLNTINTIGGYFPALYNFVLSNKILSSLVKKILGIAPQRSLPTIHSTSLREWFQKNKKRLTPANPIKEIYFFCDEFTNWNEVPIGQKAIELLFALGYKVLLEAHEESGRASLSKGLLKRAKKHAQANIETFKNKISKETPLIGIEPSAILSFRDEYPKLVGEGLLEAAKDIAPHCLLIEEFLFNEMALGHLSSTAFTEAPKTIYLHGHCHQKALSKIEASITVLSLPKNFHVVLIPSGCCGMAGSFGYEKEHFEVSQKIGALVLFPTIAELSEEAVVVASGTSCRHQIRDGVGRKAYHLVEVLWDFVHPIK